VFTGLRFEPASIVIGSAVQQVAVKVSAKDDLSGLSFEPDGPIGPSEVIGVVVTSPSGKQSLNAGAYAKWSLVEGTPQNGTWEAAMGFKRVSEPGAWKVSQLCLKDAVRNVRCYGSELSALGAPDLIVVAPGARE
jgi:hypothetical protein